MVDEDFDAMDFDMDGGSEASEGSAIYMGPVSNDAGESGVIHLTDDSPPESGDSVIAISDSDADEPW